MPVVPLPDKLRAKTARCIHSGRPWNYIVQRGGVRDAPREPTALQWNCVHNWSLSNARDRGLLICNLKRASAKLRRYDGGASRLRPIDEIDRPPPSSRRPRHEWPARRHFHGPGRCEALYDALASSRVPPRVRSGLALSAAAMALNDLRHLVAYIDQKQAPACCMNWDDISSLWRAAASPLTDTECQVRLSYGGPGGGARSASGNIPDNIHGLGQGPSGFAPVLATWTHVR